MKNITLKDLIPIWRVIIAIILTQILGGFIGYCVKPYHIMFINIWIGGAFGTFTGFLVGAIWHFSKKKRRVNLIVLPFLGFVGLTTLMVTLFSVFVAIPHFAEEAKRIGMMKILSKKMINKIDVYNRDGKSLLKTIIEKEILSQFASNCKDTEGYAPNHPKYSQSWYLIVYTEGENLELDFHVMQKDNSTIYGRFVYRKPGYMKSFGSFKSQNLRKWFDKYIINY
jgi:riboflavin transporter FmnP